MLEELERGCRSDVLGEVVAARSENAMYLCPVGTHRVSSGHKLEQVIAEREGASATVSTTGHDVDRVSLGRAAR